MGKRKPRNGKVRNKIFGEVNRKVLREVLTLYGVPRKTSECC